MKPDYSELLLLAQQSQKECSEAAMRKEWLIATSAAVRLNALSNALIAWFDEAEAA